MYNIATAQQREINYKHVAAVDTTDESETDKNDYIAAFQQNNW
jgi:hypothetical protein